jgi:hypothetical protein
MERILALAVNGRSRVLPRIILGGAAVAGLTFFAILDVPYPDAEEFVPGAAGGIAVALLIGLLFLPAKRLAWIVPVALVLTPFVWFGAYLVHISLFDTRAYPLARGLFIAVWALPIFVGTTALAALTAELPLPRSAWLAGCAVVASSIALLPPALTHVWEGPPKARFEKIDEQAGRYGGVGIGDSRTELVGIFGEPASRDENQPILPTGVDIDDDVGGPELPPDLELGSLSGGRLLPRPDQRADHRFRADQPGGRDDQRNRDWRQARGREAGLSAADLRDGRFGKR